MIRIAALNDDSLESCNEEDVGPSLEALESAASRIYRDAIKYLAKDDNVAAKACFYEALANPFIEKAHWNIGVDRPKVLPQDIALKYSCYKNLANIHMSEQAHEKACEYYMKAVQLDATEVILWQRLGAAAIKVKDFQLALIAFQEGLLLNPLHWPCLDQLLSTLFLLGLYEDCLGLIIQALKRDPGYVKALAFKDKIFELQPSLKSFAKEYFIGSEILYREVDYDVDKGNEFVSRCMKLKPEPKEPTPPPVIPPRKLLRNPKELKWKELASCLIETYDSIIQDIGTAITENIILEDTLNHFISKKVRTRQSKELREELYRVIKPGRRISRTLSHNDSYFQDLNDKCGESGDVVVKSKVPSRRQTIELGECQNAFKIGHRSSLSEKDEIREVPEDSQHSMETDEKEEVLKVKTPTEEKSPELSSPQNRDQDESEIPEAVSLKEIQKDEVAIDATMENMVEEKVETVAKYPKEDPKPIESIEDVNQELCIVEPEAAVNQLKDIMALKAPDEIFGLPPPEFEYEQDYSEYFDGGVYEEDEEDQELETGAKEAVPEEENELDPKQNMEENLENQQLEDAPVNSIRKHVRDVKSLDVETTLKNKLESDTEKDSSQSSQEKETQNQLLTVTEEQKQVPADPHEPTDQSETTAVKKSRRPKRGLERELEQLDYWGRRKAREAKRRRRTLTSKLVGAFEENEYLTWAHLLRSFIPAWLLSSETDTPMECDEKPLSDSTVLPCPQSGTAKPVDVPLCNNKQEGTPEDLPESFRRNEEEGDNSFQCRFQLKYPFLCSYWKTIEDTLDQWTHEEFEVAEFLSKYKNNAGIFHLLQQLQWTLLKKHDKIWPQNLALSYREIYKRVRSHITVGAALSQSEDPKRLLDFGVSALAYIELSISNLQTNGSLFSQREDEELMSVEDFSQVEDDLFHLNLLLERPDVWKKDYLQVYLRIGWIHAQIQMIQGLPDESVTQLQVLLDEMKLSCTEGSSPLNIDRCRVEDDKALVTEAEIVDQLNFLQRSQMLEQIEVKYDTGKYEEVVAILTRLFHKLPKGPGEGGSSTPRYTQISIFVDSLAKLGDYIGVMHWGAFCLAEASDVFQKLDSENLIEKKHWEATMKMLLLHMNEAYLSHEGMITKIRSSALSKLLGGLLDILVIQLEHAPEASQPCFGTLSCWLLFYNILSKYEQRQDAKKIDECSEKSNDAGVLLATPYPSTLFLITAHEELGKNGWCALEEGSLLMLVMDVLIRELKRPLSNEQRTLLHQSLEQVAFCLYSHPSRKTKHKHLRDHGVHQVALTFKRAVQLFKYYCPSQLPDFQSTQSPSISDDVSVLFKRFFAVIPEEFKHTDQIQKVESYLESDAPYTPFPFPEELKDCHYLLADYYFKNKNWDSAIYHYKLDVSVIPDRLDSWAPMGLAKKAQLETLLNSCEVIGNLEDFFKQAQFSRKCLEKALSIDQYYCNLWVEKGGLVYMIHSHSSRLLKQDLNPDMSIERFETLEKIKTDSLQDAEKCFLEASKIVEEGWDDESLPDERWLYQYMLGKLAEKSNRPVEVVINHYIEAGKHLHDIGAKYPAKVGYSNPQDNSVEALEMFYRIISYIIKFLHQKNDKILPSQLDYFNQTLNTLFEGPFANCRERKGQVLRAPSASLRTVRIRDNDSPDPKTEVRIFCRQLSQQIIEKSHEKVTEKLKQKETELLSNDPLQTDETKPMVVDEHALKKQLLTVFHKCLDGLKLCVTRFPHHYKSLYRLSYYYHHSKYDGDNMKARNFLLGCDFWQRVGYMPVNGLFNERKFWIQNLRVCNLFHGIWRIPHDEIDRPGSFAAHMYRCVCQCLDILQEMRDFFPVLEIAISLKNSPEKDKKYLRDNERELLCEHATQVALQTMKDKYRYLFKSSSDQGSSRNPFLMDVHRAYKQVSRHFPNLESHFIKMLIKTYVSYRGLKPEGASNLLKEADMYCMKIPHQQLTAGQSSVSLSVSGGVSSSTLGIIRRGRPPGASRGRGVSPRLEAPDMSNLKDSFAVQKAYKVYENLIKAKTLLNNKNLHPRHVLHCQKKHEEYKQQMLKYLQIPSVSRYFHASLQNVGSSGAKLPPPPGDTFTVASSDSTKVSPEKQMINSLASRSQIHGISISTVSKKSESTPLKPVKPSMSITVSQSPKGTSTMKTMDASEVSISRTTLNKISAKSDVDNRVLSLPKLPEGTTLSRQSDFGITDGKPTETHRPSEGSVSVTAVDLIEVSKKLNSNKCTELNIKSSTSVTDSKSKKNVPFSFQAAFQAAISSTSNVDKKQSSDTPKAEISSESDLKSNVSITVAKPLDCTSVNTNQEVNEEDIIVLD